MRSASAGKTDADTVLPAALCLSGGAAARARGPGAATGLGCDVRSVSQIAWDRWIPQQRATLLFVVRQGQVLLIRKKRGLGAGKINAPGGRIEPGETPRQAAERETREEVGVMPSGVAAAGELFFQFVDGLSIHGFVFRADDFEGTVIETEEAAPFWVPLDRIPYAEMWADDRHWVPWMLERRAFRGFFLFDGDRMLDRRVDV